MNRAIMDMGFFDDAFYQPEFSRYINRGICMPTGFDTYGYPENWIGYNKMDSFLEELIK